MKISPRYGGVFNCFGGFFHRNGGGKVPDFGYKKSFPFEGSLCYTKVPKVGIEPTIPLENASLSRARLPVPPLRQLVTRKSIINFRR